MRFMVKIIFAAAALFAISCHNAIPSLPEFETVKHCKYEKADGSSACKSMYIVSEEDCAEIGGVAADSCD